jgi:hypothetical protein
MTDPYPFNDGSAKPGDDFAEPPLEELEMAVEEFLGRPLSDNPEERVVALQRRITYLEDERTLLDPTDEAHADLWKRNTDELAEARRQLAEWQTQHGGRN